MGCCSCDDHDYCCRCIESDADRAQTIIADILDGSYHGEVEIEFGNADANATAIVAVLKHEHLL